jgi:hypothetical protein
LHVRNYQKYLLVTSTAKEIFCYIFFKKDKFYYTKKQGKAYFLSCFTKYNKIGTAYIITESWDWDSRSWRWESEIDDSILHLGEGSRQPQQGDLQGCYRPHGCEQRHLLEVFLRGELSDAKWRSCQKTAGSDS